MSDSPSPLELATESELVDELERRNNGLVLLLHRECALDKKGETDSILIWRGGLTLAMGMLARASARLAGLVCSSDQHNNNRLEG